MTVRHIEETHRRQKQKPRATELVFILDCSGSMAGMGSDVIGGFNAMLEKQQKSPDAAGSPPCCLTANISCCMTGSTSRT